MLSLLSLSLLIIGDADANNPGIPTTCTGNIIARYCPPEVVFANRNDISQYFVSGITENKLYWSGLGYPGKVP